MKKSLLTFALEQEAQGHFSDYNCLFTGVGKINAAFSLLHYLSENARPSCIVNLGTAGSATFNAGQTVHCTRFIQRDMDVTPLGFAKYQTPFSEIPTILEVFGPETNLPKACCGTGDHFDIAHTGDDYDVVDMEGYALAHICHKKQIPFLSLKYISDGADGQAHEHWEQALEDGAKALKAALKNILTEAS